MEALREKNPSQVDQTSRFKHRLSTVALPMGVSPMIRLASEFQRK
jgi:hypothetical protein